MLKIETVKWFGKCPRHPMFDPAADGIGAIKGGCTHCQNLQAIYESHQRTLQLMRTIAPIQTRHKEPNNPSPDMQRDLFVSLL
jgi:hypothetical protein